MSLLKLTCLTFILNILFLHVIKKKKNVAEMVLTSFSFHSGYEKSMLKILNCYLTDLFQ